jgi:hypothetical protein
LLKTVSLIGHKKEEEGHGNPENTAKNAEKKN